MVPLVNLVTRRLHSAVHSGTPIARFMSANTCTHSHACLPLSPLSVPCTSYSCTASSQVHPAAGPLKPGAMDPRTGRPAPTTTTPFALSGPFISKWPGCRHGLSKLRRGFCGGTGRARLPSRWPPAGLPVHRESGRPALPAWWTNGRRPLPPPRHFAVAAHPGRAPTVRSSPRLRSVPVLHQSLRLRGGSALGFPSSCEATCAPGIGRAHAGWRAHAGSHWLSCWPANVALASPNASRTPTLLFSSPVTRRIFVIFLLAGKTDSPWALLSFGADQWSSSPRCVRPDHWSTGQHGSPCIPSAAPIRLSRAPIHRWKLEAFARGDATRRGGQREGKRARPVPGAQVALPELGEPMHPGHLEMNGPAGDARRQEAPQPWR